MKRIQSLVCLLLAAVLLVSLASCAAAGDSFAPNGEGAVEMPDMDVGVKEDGAPENAPEVDGEAPLPENPFLQTSQQAVATLSADVDTASYAYFRKLVQQGAPLSQLKKYGRHFRTEEFINYFDYNVAQPKEGELFGVDSAIYPCPWNPGHWLLRMTMQAEVAVNDRGNNLVFLIDVSGSMSSEDKLPLLKKAFETLTAQLTERDVVSIVTYSGKEEVVLEGCSGGDTEKILKAIRSLKASGSTNGEAGLSKAYEVAAQHRIEGGNNRIIMASDGDLNVGISSAEELKTYVEAKRDGGIYLSVLGFGTGNYRDSNMESLADHGNGVYYYIDGESEAKKVFGADLLGTLYTVAKDVKLQITFDPNVVKAYRLIGYENRLLNEEDFTDDTKDAGEVGAGHQVTVCFELDMGDPAQSLPAGNYLELAVRYKEPDATQSLENRYSIGAAQVQIARDDDIFLGCVIQTAMLLRESKYVGNTTLSSILQTLETLDLSARPERMEFVTLLRKLTN